MSAIREIILPKKAPLNHYVIRGSTSDQQTLKNLARINLFVGANNTGKSRFLRELARIKKLTFVSFDLTDD